jgi:hypothetical protein
MRASTKRADVINGGVVAEEGELELTILIPCLNEAETIATCIGKALRYLDRACIAGEVLVSDNGSTDRSVEIAQSLGARVVPAPIRGYGGAIRCGIGAARGRYIIMGDADDSYDFSDLTAFVEVLRAGGELVMGNRFRGGIAPGAMPFLHRYLGNPALSWLGRLLFRIPIGDFHCGLRGFNRESIQDLNLRTTGMEFASEMVVAASLRGLNIREVPTTLAKDGRSRPPHLNTWRDGWRHLRFLMLHSPRWTFGYPGIALVATGSAAVTALLRGPLQLGDGVSVDVRTFLLGCLAIVVGAQSLTFGLIARRFTTTHNLLPSNRNAQRLLDAVSMEGMLQLAGLLAVAGFGGVAYAGSVWAGQEFGALSGGSLMRGMILSVSAIVIAVQLSLSAFLLGVLDLRPGGNARTQQRYLKTLFPSS